MLEININLDKKCVRCGKKGTTKGGLCLSCIANSLKRGDYNHVIGKARRECIKQLRIGEKGGKR